MIRRARAREQKRIRQARTSTVEDKYRRHRNKERIWRRCTLKLAYVRQESES